MVELCEVISVNIVEMASFELFSSVPEDFAVYTSDRSVTAGHIVSACLTLLVV